MAKMVNNNPSAVFGDTTRPAQRFQWKMNHGDDWMNGVCVSRRIHSAHWWTIIAGKNQGSFNEDPWEIMGHVIGDVVAFRWVDNDHEWEPK